jgi:small subunit ribosomal protein S21
MIIVKVKQGNIERALKKYKSKIIKTRQMREVNKRREHVKKSVLKREEKNKAIYRENKKREDD